MNRQPLVRLVLGDDEVFIDGFAGGGGTSTGIEMALGRSPDIAINHDAEALAMHEVNHPTTRHIKSNIKTVNWYRLLSKGQRCGAAWFSPDCTFHSKARGGKPFRDRDRARRIRGLVWEMVRCAVALRPRVLFMENVEEVKDWGPLDQLGRIVPATKGKSWRKVVARLRNLGYALEYRELRATPFGAPTIRKRLIMIARRDGQPIVWPTPTHGPCTGRPFRTAAECIDFSLPVPSIFLTPAQAKAWGKAHGVSAPKRPLALATQRRIARGIFRFVLDTPEPFIIRYNSERGDECRAQRLNEPISTLDTSNRFALVAATLVNNSELRGDRVYPLNEPIRTITAANCRTYQLVAAFLAKHNGGHEATGQTFTRPMDTITVRENKALVTSHLVKLRGGLFDHVLTSQDVREPAPTLTAGGTHLAEVRAFLVKFYGTKKDGRPLLAPLDTVTTKERFGLVTVTIAGEEYIIVDIGMRMLSPRELFLCQGFPKTYQIDCEVTLDDGTRKRLTKKSQTRLCGNSVPPDLAAAVVGANLTTCAEAVA